MNVATYNCEIDNRRILCWNLYIEIPQRRKNTFSIGKISKDINKGSV